jgi:uncharacterized protein (TIGR03435 family)
VIKCAGKTRVPGIAIFVVYSVFVKAVAQGPAPEQSGLAFDAVSIKPKVLGGRRISSDPGTLRMTSVNAMELITFAYQRTPAMPASTLNVPAKFYDVIAKTSAPSTMEQQRMMLRKALEERFALKCHMEATQGEVLALVLGPKPHLEESVGDGELRIGQGGFTPDRRDWIFTGRRVTTADIAQYMSTEYFLEGEGRPVIDKTGLTGRYDFKVEVTAEWMPPLDVPLPEGASRAIQTPVGERNLAIAKHLGLKLEPQRGPIERLVVDHIERPSEN